MATLSCDLCGHVYRTQFAPPEDRTQVVSAMPPQYAPPVTPPQVDWMSITSLVLGILSLVIWCAGFLSVLFAALAVLFGGLALRRQRGGRGMAIGGLVTSIIGLALWAIVAGITVWGIVV